MFGSLGRYYFTCEMCFYHSFSETQGLRRCSGCSWIVNPEALRGVVGSLLWRSWSWNLIFLTETRYYFTCEKCFRHRTTTVAQPLLQCASCSFPVNPAGLRGLVDSPLWLELKISFLVAFC